jgi:hypothetical protein
MSTESTDETTPESTNTAETGEATQVCTTGFVIHTHEPAPGDQILCVVSCDCGHPSALPALFNEGELVTLYLRAPAEDHPRGAKDEHPRIDVHINPGDEINHDLCFTFDTCGPCFTKVWDDIFRNGGGRIGVHADPDDENSVIVAPFRIDNWRETRAAVQTVQSRMVVSN